MTGFIGINIVIASLTGMLVSHCKRTYVKGLKINILGKTIGNIRNSVQLKIPETYKIMWIEKGLIVLAVLVLLLSEAHILESMKKQGKGYVFCIYGQI